MTSNLRTSVIAIAIAAGWALPAHADAVSDAAIQQELAAMRAQMGQMAQRIDTLEGQLAAAKAVQVPATLPAPVAVAAPPPAVAAAAPPEFAVNWKGAPEITGKGGWSFKPRGRIHFDNGIISTPGDYAASRNLGFNSRFRRVRLGAEGTMPGGFGYKLEVDFANGSVGFGDAFVSYVPGKAPLLIRLGHIETLDGMEQITSSNNVTFMERSSFNDAFLNSRRLGAAVAWHSKNDDWRAEAGLFVAHGVDGSFDNDGWIGAARLVYAPKALGGQLHFGVNYQHRDFAANTSGVAATGTNMPSTQQLARYRARPNSQLTDIRFVDTGSFAARSDRIIGAEAAAIFKDFYFTSEAQWLKADAYAAGSLASGLDSFTGGNLAVVPTRDPGFFGVYGEVGWFLTGETRGYKRGEGIWNRTKVLNPVSKGGMGAFQLAARFEYLDLEDDALINGPTNNFSTGTTSLAALGTRQGRGGTQTSYLLGLNWLPLDYVRFMINYGRVNVKGGPLAALVDPLSTVPVNQRKYRVDVLQTRLQLEF